MAFYDPHYNTIQASVPTPSIFGITANSAYANSADPTPASQGDDNAPDGSRRDPWADYANAGQKEWFGGRTIPEGVDGNPWLMPQWYTNQVVEKALKGTYIDGHDMAFLGPFYAAIRRDSSIGLPIDQAALERQIDEGLTGLWGSDEVIRGLSYQRPHMPTPSIEETKKMYQNLKNSLLSASMMNAIKITVHKPSIGETSVDEAQYGQLPVGSKTDGSKNPQSNNNAASSAASFTGGQMLNEGDFADSTGSADGVPASVRMQERTYVLEKEAKDRTDKGASQGAFSKDYHSLTEVIGELVAFASMAFLYNGIAEERPGVAGVGTIPAIITALLPGWDVLTSAISAGIASLWYANREFVKWALTPGEKKLANQMQSERNDASTAQDPSRIQATVTAPKFREFVWKTVLSAQAYYATQSLKGRQMTEAQKAGMRNIQQVINLIDGSSYPPSPEFGPMSLQVYRQSGASRIPDIKNDLQQFMDSFIPISKHQWYRDYLDTTEAISRKGRSAMTGSGLFPIGPKDLPATGGSGDFGGRGAGYKNTKWGGEPVVKLDADSNSVNQPNSIPYGVLTTLQAIPEGQLGTVEDRGAFSSHVPRTLPIVELFLTEPDLEYLDNIWNPYYENNPFASEGVDDPPHIGYGSEARGPRETVAGKGMSEIHHTNPTMPGGGGFRTGHSTEPLPYNKSLRATGKEQGAIRRGRKKASKAKKFYAAK